MMPLTLAPEGVKQTIRKINGKDELRRHLENLGFVEGGEICVVTSIGGNVIVDIKGSRVAVSREMALKIII